LSSLKLTEISSDFSGNQARRSVDALFPVGVLTERWSTAVFCPLQ